MTVAALLESRAMFDLVSMGEAMVEFYGDGPLSQCRTFHRSTGGDALNLLVAASRLGGRTAFVTRLARDPFYKYLKKTWEEFGVDLRWVQTTEGFNAVYFISVRSDGERDFTYYRAGSAASRLASEDVSDEIWSQTRFFFCSGITQALSESCRAAVRSALERARRQGACTAFDVNFRASLRSGEQARLESDEVLTWVQTLFVSLGEESEMLTASSSARVVAERMRARGIGRVVVKDGDRGVVVASDRGLVETPALQVRVVDTTGAGDAFNGAFLYALSRGMDEEQASRVGVVAAGLKVTGRGAIDSLPDRNTVAAYLRKHFNLDLP